MGLHTTYVGYVEITPALSEQETAYLTAFNASRRVERPGGPFAVPANPWEEEPPVVARDRPPAGQPGLWCPWQPCREGHCLRWDGQEKPSGGQEWLTYLIDAFLRPGAKARRDRTGRFDGFTFDHTCQGVLVGEGSESREVFALEVKANRVRRRVLLSGLSMMETLGIQPLPRDLPDSRAERRARRERWLAAIAADEAEAGPVIPAVVPSPVWPS